LGSWLRILIELLCSFDIDIYHIICYTKDMDVKLAGCYWDVEYKRDGVMLSLDSTLLFHPAYQTAYQNIREFILLTEIGKQVSFRQIWLYKAEYLELLILSKS